MTSLSEAPENAAAIQRIEALDAGARPQWGKMTCAQMLAHCQKPLQVAAGELKLKRRLIGRLLGGWAKKKFVVSDAPFKPNSPTDPDFRIRDERDFEREKASLIALVKRYGEQGVVTRDPHPFFGPMSTAEWDRLLSKHLDHHLRQFGV
jgi:Protein of unknown function (DUF1569)